MSRRVQLTWDHIEQGKPKNAYACPVQRALQEAGYRAMAYSSVVYLDGQAYLTGLELNAWMVRYDDGGEARPGTLVVGEGWIAFERPRGRTSEEG